MCLNHKIIKRVRFDNFVYKIIVLFTNFTSVGSETVILVDLLLHSLNTSSKPFWLVNTILVTVAVEDSDLARKEKRMGREMLKAVKTIGRTKPSSCRLSPDSCWKKNMEHFSKWGKER